MYSTLHVKQFGFWKLRRDGLPNVAIARQCNVSRQAVSHALISIDKKIENILREMASANQIEVKSLNTEHGILFGRSLPFQVTALIFISEKHGVQVWYEHEGNCDTCSRYRECIELLWDYSDELNVSIEKCDDPTKMAEELFEKLKEMVK